MRDIYGTPKTEFRTKELKSVALAKEIAIIGLNRIALKNVRPGNIDDLHDAEERLSNLIKNLF